MPDLTQVKHGNQSEKPCGSRGRVTGIKKAHFRSPAPWGRSGLACFNQVKLTLGPSKGRSVAHECLLLALPAGQAVLITGVPNLIMMPSTFSSTKKKQPKTAWQRNKRRICCQTCHLHAASEQQRRKCLTVASNVGTHLYKSELCAKQWVISCCCEAETLNAEPWCGRLRAGPCEHRSC